MYTSHGDCGLVYTVTRKRYTNIFERRKPHGIRNYVIFCGKNCTSKKMLRKKIKEHTQKKDMEN